MKIEEYPWSEEMANDERNSGSNDKKKQCFLPRQLPKLSCHALKNYTCFLTVEQL